MQLAEFLGRVLPAAGEKFYCATVDQSKNAKFTEIRLNSVGAIGALAAKLKGRTNLDLYFATGSYGSTRSAESAQYKKAFYVDLDCGPGKGYATKAEAIADIKRMCDEGFLPPSIVVDSGNGIHCYWTLTEEMTGPAWRLLALTFKKFCVDRNFRADPTCTADAARILRVPTSLNVKDPQHPKVTRILRGIGTKDYTVAEFSAAVGAVPSKLTGKLGVWVGDDDLSGAIWTKGPRHPADHIVAKCEVFKHSVATGGEGQVEPLWQRQLLVLAYTTNGEKFIHPISNKHATYSERETEYKFKEQLAKVSKEQVGPTTCDEFYNYASELCQKCEFRGSVKSPLGIDAKVNVGENKPPEGYEVRKNSVVHITYEGEGGERKPVEHIVCHFGIQDFHVSHVVNEELQLSFLAIVANHPKEVALKVSMLHDKKALVAALSRQGVAIHDRHCKEFRDFMVTWVERMQNARKETHAFAHMGWVRESDRTGFALGSTILWDKGGDTLNSLDDKGIADQYTAIGKINEWISIANFVTAQNKPAINAIVATAFAAPLLQLVGQDGFFMSFTSAASGSGKTTALRVAQSVWGDPARGISMLDDTPMSVVRRLGILHNLPAYWDEVRIKDNPEAFVKFMFQLSLGKERSRLSSTIKLQDMGTWSTMMVIATNDRLVDHVAAETKSTDAGRARIFEVEVSELDKPDFSLADRVSRLKENYGHAGMIYARHLVNHAAEIAKSVHTTTAALVKKINPQPAERFWISGAAALLVGAHLSVKLGLTKIDINTLAAWLVAQVYAQRDSMRADFKTAPQGAIDYVWEYCAEFRDHFFVCDYLSQRGLVNIGQIHWLPERGRILGTIAKIDRKVRIGRTHFADWLYRRKITPSQVIDELVKSGQAHASLSKIAVGMPNVVQERIRALDIRRVSDDVIDNITDGRSTAEGD